MLTKILDICGYHPLKIGVKAGTHEDQASEDLLENSVLSGFSEIDLVKWG